MQLKTTNGGDTANHVKEHKTAIQISRYVNNVVLFPSHCKYILLSVDLWHKIKARSMNSIASYVWTSNMAKVFINAT